MRASTAHTILAITLTGLLSACANSERAVSDEQPGDAEPWFCELAENEADWQCIRSIEAARSPNPARLPHQALGPQPERPARPAASQPYDAPAGERDEPPVAPASAPVNEDVPLHVALAYRPGQAQRLIDLPGEFWAVQLAAFGSPEQLSEYAARHELRGMSAARIARNSQLFYVLLLGVYETRENAERASATVPDALNIDPWIRSLGSLQQAMRAGETIAPID